MLAGVDGCRAGWVAVTGADPGAVRLSVHRSFGALLAALPGDAVVAVDMPIGLPESIEGSGRAAEQAVRPHLGPRQSSVFTIPARAVVEMGGAMTGRIEHDYPLHRRASALARTLSDPPRGVSIQAFYLFPKILEIDAALRADAALAARVHESHPEVAFTVLNHGVPMATPKKIRGGVNPVGLAERWALLARHGLATGFLTVPPPPGVGADDVVDAAACWLVARRIARAEAVSFPDPPGRDRYGLPIAIRA